jgi:hypothetical protein
LAGLDDATKQYLRDRASGAGMGGSKMLDNIDSTELAELLNGSKALLTAGGGLQSKDDPNKLDPKKLMAYLKTETATNPQFLANLINASKELDPTYAESQISKVIKTGSAVEEYKTYSDVDPAQRKYLQPTGSDVSPPVVPDTYIAQTTIHASVLDRQTIVQIEAAIAKALRDQQERGPSVPTGGPKTK